MLLKLNLQLFASKKGQGSTRNGRDSNPKYLGVKKYDGEAVKAGNIIVRQRGSKFYAGTNAKLGKDYTLFALTDEELEKADILIESMYSYLKAVARSYSDFVKLGDKIEDK